MKDFSITTTVNFTFDDPINITYDEYGDVHSVEIVTAEYNKTNEGSERIAFYGYELTKSGKRRKNGRMTWIYVPSSVGKRIDGQYVFFPTGIDDVKERGILIARKILAEEAV